MTTTTAPAGGLAGYEELARTPRVPMSRLVRVELRKLRDTRAGYWLLATIVLITAAVMVIFMFAAPPEELTFENFAGVGMTPQAILLPILGILLVTAEWTQRTGLVTFTLEPNRGRIAVAKVEAALIAGVIAVLIAIALGALSNVIGIAIQDGDGSWSYGFVGVRNLVLLQLIGVLGVAFGMLIMNSAAAIVAYFAVPTIWGILTSTVGWIRDAGEWVDLNTTTTALSQNDIHGQEWLKLSVSVAIWVLLPLALGVLRLLRRELKSA